MQVSWKHCLFPLLAAAALLSACGKTPESAVPTPPAETEPPFDIAGEETGLPLPAADATLGSYYNDYLRETLALDGRGNALLQGEDGTRSATYAIDESGALVLDFPEETLRGSYDADGDLLLDGRSGLYLRDWDFWGITVAETGTHQTGSPLSPAPAEDGAPPDGGEQRYRDFENHIAFSYAEGIEVFTEPLIGAVAATDGNGGFVSGRNVTDNYRTRIGTDNEFLEDYIKTFIFADFHSFYGDISGFESLALLDEDIDGRIASATLQINGAAQSIAVKVILYTSTYPDGTVNYICKACFAPAEDAARLSALAEQVYDMGAVRALEEPMGQA